MNEYITLLQNTFHQAPWLSSKGPALCSQMYVDRFQQTMMVVEFEVANGSFLDEATVPYGMFVEIRNPNTNKARLVIMMAPLAGEEPAPVFKTRCKDVYAPTRFICRARECRTILDKSTNPVPDSGTNIWESTINDYDDAHVERVTTTIITYTTATDTVYDDAMQEHHSIEQTLVQSISNDSGYTVGTPGYFISYEQVKCGWWLKTKEYFNTGVKMTLCGVANYYWPRVLLAVPEVAPVIGEVRGGPDDGEEYIIKTCINHIIKDSYNGPCKAVYSTAFLTGMPNVCPIPTAILTDSIEYDGLFFDYRLVDCLHPTITFSESVGSFHPQYKASQVRSKTFPATSLLDWPASVFADYDVKPYKGGYHVTSVTIYPPS